MIVFILLALTEVLTFTVLRHHLYERHLILFYVSSVFNAVLSLWLWILTFEIILYNGIFDTPRHIWMIMNFSGMIFAVIFPRILIIFLHFTGTFFRRRTGRELRWITTTGLVVSVIIFLIIAEGTIFGRFNFRTEEYEVRIDGLKKELDGLKIVQISDLHLASFSHHREKLKNVMETINREDPDLIINTGDFVSYGWREFDRNDTILSVAKSRLGNFAVLGNHDFGTYHPHFSEAERNNNVLLISQLVRASGYTLLNDEHTYVMSGEAKIALIGVNTMGSFPDIIYGDLDKALGGLEKADLTLLLTHDPNQWEKEIMDNNAIDITFAGHTHGMQIGIITRKFRWSPAKFFYPQWNGLFSKEGRYLIVNRGLGVLGIPARIWMPPEISVIKITRN